MNTIDLLFENTKIKGKVILSDSLHENKALLKDKTLYKFIWVLSGQLELDVDHQPVVLKEGQLLTLSHLHHVDFVRVDGEYLSLLFNSNFYCIYGNDHEVSCNGLLFHGSSHVVIFDLSGEERRKIATLTGIMREEFESRDHLQDEMLRVLLKRFIILCTRIAENRQGVRKENGMQFETIRKFYVLVDTHFKEKKQVQEYADMLNKSPKTLANLLSSYQQPSAIRVIHNRVQAEAERLLLYSSKSSKEIALMLGFEDQATFSRFFKNATGLSTTEYLQTGKQALALRRPGGKTGQLDGPAALREDPAEGEAGPHLPAAGCMGHGQDPPLAVSAKKQGTDTLVAQPLFRVQSVPQQIGKGEQAVMRVDAMPGKMQGRDGKTVFPETVQERPILQRAEHGPRIENKAGRARSGP